MSIEEFMQLQKERLIEFKRLSESNPTEAERVARENLQSAGIIDSNGCVTAPYK